MDLCQINKGNSSLLADIIKVKQKLDNSNYNDKKNYCDQYLANSERYSNTRV